jgi:hypothetical protein
MLGKRKKHLKMSVVLVGVYFALATSGFAARIVPMGKVSIIEGGRVIGEFDREAPLPEGFLLRCEAGCAIQLADADMEVEPRTEFSVKPATSHHDLMVQKGTVYYALNKSSRPLHLDTPIEKAAIGHSDMTSGGLKGYVRADQNVTEIGVLGGGTAMLEIESDKLYISSGEKLKISAADSEKITSETNGPESPRPNTNFSIEAIASVQDPDRSVYRGGGRHGDAGDADSAEGGDADSGASEAGDAEAGAAEAGSAGNGEAEAGAPENGAADAGAAETGSGVSDKNDGKNNDKNNSQNNGKSVGKGGDGEDGGDTSDGGLGGLSGDR